MDHCPWVGGCVGYLNQGYFVLFLFWASFGSFVCLLINGYSLYQSMVKGYPDLEVRISGLFAFIITFSVSFSSGALLYFHVGLVRRNETTLETYSNGDRRSEAKKKNMKFHNPYDLGDANRNALQVFGKPFWRLAFKPSFVTPLGNGHDWEINPRILENIEANRAVETLE
ncbi:hypothetical protein KIPB_006586 [Kipferlia bialata]|uniref:Palmitoyltransferase n=1 Tax=Kipferlia bialata TaxID=797122 RepID=A0A9K3CX92_9EUKA|nr:hypothetical protein KIPB_006586 [Kipferlia bialata]|eukprot:g6586.t1